MCIAVPAEVIKIEGDLATIGVEGNTRQVSIGLLPRVGVGDYVLVHAGYAVQKLDPEEARETLKLLEEFYATPVE